MKYFLKHITQMGLLTTILLSVGALCLWIPSFVILPWQQVLPTCLLSLVNVVMLMYVCYHGNLTRMLDLLTGFSYLLASASLRGWHTDWRAQLIVFCLLLVLLVFQMVDRHRFRSAAEQTFMMTLLLGIASYWLPTLVLLLIPIVLALMYRNTFDGQGLLAILLGLATCVIYIGVAYLFSWIELPWLNFFDPQINLRWVEVLALVVSFVVVVICYTGEALWRGIVFVCYVAVCVMMYLLSWVLF